MAALKYWDSSTSQWVTLQGGPKGDPGLLSGSLADRPVDPGYSVAYVAEDSDDPLSTFDPDNSSWKQIDIPSAKRLASLDIPGGQSVSLVNTGWTIIPWTVTADVVSPGGILMAMCDGFMFAANTFAADGSKNEGIILNYSTDHGSSWNPVGFACIPRTLAVITQVTSVMIGTAQIAKGTEVRFGVTARLGSNASVTSAVPTRLTVVALG